MDYFSIWHSLIVVAIVLLLFGKTKVSDLMGDLTQGIKALKRGVAEDDTDARSETGISTHRDERNRPSTSAH